MKDIMTKAGKSACGTNTNNTQTKQTVWWIKKSSQGKEKSIA